jgi:sugar/nucleoside kinase (ribokinase family)
VSAPTVTAFGELCLHVTTLDAPQGHDAFTRGTVTLSPGGGAAIVAAQVVALGQTAHAAGFLGDDAIGDLVERLLVGLGVDVDATRAAAATTCVSIQVRDDGSHAVVASPGGATAETIEDAAKNPIGRFAYTPAFPGYEGVLARLAAATPLVVADFGFRPWLANADGYREEVLRRVAGVDVAILSGAAFDDDYNRVLAAACRERGCETVVTTLGPRGAVVVTSGGRVTLDAIRAVAVNTLGAGDAFVAGLVVGLAERGEPIEAARYGQAVAAARVARLDPPAPREAVEALLR